MNKYLYVVEGKTDVAKLKKLGAEYVLKTDGFNVSSSGVLEFLKYCFCSRSIILLLDPDGPGKQIKKIIIDTLNKVDSDNKIVEINIDKKKAIAHHKVGVTQMNSKLLLSYISPYLSEDQNSFEKEIYTSDLLEKMNLVGSKSKENREKIKRKMPFISISTAKSLKNDLEMLKIEPEKIWRIINDKD